jgi:GT2 family glycosyltransferase
VTAPHWTVCIPTYARPDRLRRCLAAVTAQEPPPGGFDVVIADDASPDRAAVDAVIAEATAASPVPITLLRLERNAGPGVARNCAWRAAAGDVIAFTDDDCEPAPGWLQALAAAVDEGNDVVQGRTAPDPARAYLLRRPLTRSLDIPSASAFFQTCNIAYRRSLLERLEGFDERFRLIGVDTDLGWRAKKAGAVVQFCADALVHHEVAMRPWRVEVRSRRRWADVPHVLRTHPELRTLAWRPYVYRKGHVVPLVLAVATPLLLSRLGRRVWIGAVLAVLGSDALQAGDPAAAAGRWAERLGDAYETAIVVRASADAKVLLL